MAVYSDMALEQPEHCLHEVISPGPDNLQILLAICKTL